MLTIPLNFSGLSQIIIDVFRYDVENRADYSSIARVVVQMFAHIASDAVLKPLGHFAKSAASGNYPALCAGDHVEAELSAIKLKSSRPDEFN